MVNEWVRYLVRIPIIELAIYALLFWSLWRVWRHDKGSEKVDDIGERTLAATVIMGQLSAVITGSSIILAGIGAFVAIGAGKFGFPQNWHLFYGALWVVVALGVAVYTMGILPTRTPTESFVRSAEVAFMCSTALFCCLMAGARFLLAVGAIMFN